MSEDATFRVGQHVRLVSGGGCNAAYGFTNGEICEVTDTNNGGRYLITIESVPRKTIGYVNADQLEAVPAKPATLDETTNPADVEWGEVRSAVAAKDWRRAWEVVGTDHEGEATPGEAYIFGNARRVACVSAALVAWRRAELPMLSSGVRRPLPEVRKAGARVLGTNERWQRIKAIAAWESSAAAQYAKREPVQYNFRSSEIRLGGRVIGGYDAGMTGSRTASVVIDDPVENDPELYGTERGVPGLFRNPSISANIERVMTRGGDKTYTLTVNGERQTYAVADPIRGTITVDSANANALLALVTGELRAREAISRIASGNAAIRPNPAPHGPTRRRRR